MIEMNKKLKNKKTFIVNFEFRFSLGVVHKLTLNISKIFFAEEEM